MSDRLFAEQSARDWIQRTEGRKISGNRAFASALLISSVVLLLGLVILAYGQPYQHRLLFAALVNVVIVCGLQIFMGNSNIANLSHSGFAGVGAYAAAVMATPTMMKTMMIPNAPWGLAGMEFDVATTIVMALLVTAALALVTGLVVARLNGISATILTLALLVIIHSVLLQWDTLTRGNQAFFGIPKVASVEWALVAAVVAIVIARMFKDSRIGVQLRAIADNELAAEAMGVNVWRLKLIAWVVSCTICGAGGILFALYMGTINLRSFHFHPVFLTLAMLILGGMRTVTGAVVGVVTLAIFMEFIRYVEGGPLILGVQFPELLGLSGLALGIIIVAFMILRPSGLMGNFELDDFLRNHFSRSGRDAEIETDGQGEDASPDGSRR